MTFIVFSVFLQDLGEAPMHQIYVRICMLMTGRGLVGAALF